MPLFNNKTLAPGTAMPSLLFTTPETVYALTELNKKSTPITLPKKEYFIKPPYILLVYNPSRIYILKSDFNAKWTAGIIDN